MIKNYNKFLIKESMVNLEKAWYFTPTDLGKKADKWIKENPHNNGYAIMWEVIDPEDSAYPEIEEFLLSKGLNIGDKALLHDEW